MLTTRLFSYLLGPRASMFSLRLLAGLLAWASTAFAAPPAARAEDVAVDGFLPAPDQTGFLGLPSTRTPGSLGLDATLWLGYGLHTLESSAIGAGKGTPVAHRFDGTAILQLGILTRGAVAMRMPFVMVQRGDDLGTQKLAVAAAGNPAFEGRLRVYGNPVRADGSVNDGAAVALRGVVHLPLNTSNTLFADNSTRLDVSVISDLEMFGIRAGAALGYRHTFDKDRFGGHRFSDALTLLLGLRVPFPLIARAKPGKVQESVVAELEVATNPLDFFSGPTTPVEGRLAYRAGFKDFFVTLGGGAGFRSAIGSPDFRALFAFGYSPRVHDQDGDGIPDSQDQCVHLAEDRDGFQDDDGCPDDDNDNDMILDEDDRCPLEPAEMGRDEDEDGCTDN